MDSPGRELTLSSHPWPLPRGSSRGRVVGLRPLADEGESRRPKAVCNPGSGVQPRRAPWREPRILRRISLNKAVQPPPTAL